MRCQSPLRAASMTVMRTATSREKWFDSITALYLNRMKQ